MDMQLHKQGVEVDDRLEKALQRKVEKIERNLKPYHGDVSLLEVWLERDAQTTQYFCAIKLDAFKANLHARKGATQLREAVDKAFDAMMRELDHHRAKINKSLQASS
ncbi:MAG TPA: HPF/RaiA family ribosome-associated protein [bacterium]|nr:HPF/RaiA family ribosome-associated protein [bacterium]